VTLVQFGVAPYYYDLSLAIKCAGMTNKSLSGAETLIEASKIFVFVGAPATSACLRTVSVSLESSNTMAGRPIKFAQGNGFLMPLPGTSTYAPTLSPTRKPTMAPITPAPTSGKRTPTGLINADTDMDLVRMTNGMVFNLFPFPRLSVRADPPLYCC
jgi:hypothetical protein